MHAPSRSTRPACCRSTACANTPCTKTDWHGWAQAWQQLDALLERPEWQAASRRSDFTLTLGGSARSQTWQGQAGSGWQSLLQKFKARRGYSASLAEVRAL